jgi:AcrR family transcriptional regulator
VATKEMARAGAKRSRATAASRATATQPRPVIALDAKPVRRTQQERSRDTREKLLQATIEVLLESGYAGLTTAQVDQRAGVSSGARVHHFPAKADLVIAATRMAYDRAAELGQRRAEEARRSPEPLRHFVEDCRSIYFDWPFITSVEIVIAARTDKALMAKIHPVLQQFHGTMKATWIGAFVDAGYERAEAEIILRMTLNLIRGMALNNIWENDEAEYERLIEIWCQRAKRPKK